MLFYLLVSVGISLFCVRIMEVSGFLVPGCIFVFLYFSSGIWEIRLHRRLRETGCFWCRRIHTRKFFLRVLAGTSLCAMDLLPALVVFGIASA